MAAVQSLLVSRGCPACNSNVEAASTLLLQAGQPRETIRTERFGPTG